MSIIKTVAVFSVITLLTLLLALWLAGASGVLIGLMIVAVMAVKMGGYLGLFAVPPAVKKLTNWVIAIGIVSISIIWISGAVGKQLQEFQAEKTVPTPARVAEHKKIPLEEEFPKVVAVGTEWKRIKLPYCSWFDVSPVDNKETVKVRLLDGREFNLFPDGSLFYRGKKVDDFGKIPGVDIDIKATETSAKVMISVGKKL